MINQFRRSNLGSQGYLKVINNMFSMVTGFFWPGAISVTNLCVSAWMVTVISCAGGLVVTSIFLFALVLLPKVPEARRRGHPFLFSNLLLLFLVISNRHLTTQAHPSPVFHWRASTAL
jgi:hypothetical protein